MEAGNSPRNNDDNVQIMSEPGVWLIDCANLLGKAMCEIFERGAESSASEAGCDTGTPPAGIRDVLKKGIDFR